MQKQIAYGKKRRTYYKKNKYKKGTTKQGYTTSKGYWTLYKQLKNLTKKQNLSQKIKSTETTHKNATACTVAGEMFNLVQIAQGDNAGQRSGDSAVLRNIQLRIALLCTNEIEARVRIIVFKHMGVIQDEVNDKPIVTGADYGLLNNANCQALTDVSQQKVYRILHDKVFTVGGVTPTILNINIFKKFYNHKLLWDASSTQASDACEKGSVWLCILTDVDAPNSPLASIEERCKFNDS